MRTWFHDILCHLTIKSDTGQHSQFLRCLKTYYNTNSRNLSIFSCITSRASTVDSFTTLSILTQISSTQKFQKTRPKSFKSPSQNAFSKRPKRLSNPNWAQASQPAYPPKSGPLAQRTKNNSSNSNSYLTFPPKTAKIKDKGDLLFWFKVFPTSNFLI